MTLEIFLKKMWVYVKYKAQYFSDKIPSTCHQLKISYMLKLEQLKYLQPAQQCSSDTNMSWNINIYLKYVMNFILNIEQTEELQIYLICYKGCVLCIKK